MAEEGGDESVLAARSYKEFTNKQFSESISTLTKLMALKPQDSKVIHNKGVAEFHASNHLNLDAFKKTLVRVQQLLSIKPAENDMPEDIDHCVVFYNQAVVHFLEKHYEKALSISMKLFTMIQLIDASLGLKVSLLLVELNLYYFQVDKALTNIAHIESQFLPSKFNAKLIKYDRDECSPCISLDEFRTRLLNHKARALFAKKAYSDCEKVIENIYLSNAQNFSTILIKAQLDVINNRFQDALDTIIVLQEDIDYFLKMGDTRTLVFYNDIACIYHYLCKPSLCSFFMSKAFNIYKANVETEKKTGERDLFQPCIFPKIMYNKGVALLFAQKPNEAFDCFTEAVQVMHKSSLVWLRLAECCFMCYKVGNKDVFNFTERRKDLISDVVITEDKKNVVLNDGIYKSSVYSCEPQNYAVPVPTLEFASLCAQNALTLLKDGNKKLEHAILSALSFIHLTIGDPIKAYRYITKLQEDQEASPKYKFLSKIYLCEAYLLMNRTQDAVEILNPKYYKDCDISQESFKCGWLPNSQTTAQAVLQYNLAVVLAVRGDFKKSSELLKHVWLNKGEKSQIPVHVIALALYIELVSGHTDVAWSILQQNCPQVGPLKK